MPVGRGDAARPGEAPLRSPGDRRYHQQVARPWLRADEMGAQFAVQQIQQRFLVEIAAAPAQGDHLPAKARDDVAVFALDVAQHPRQHVDGCRVGPGGCSVIGAVAEEARAAGALQGSVGPSPVGALPRARTVKMTGAVVLVIPGRGRNHRPMTARYTPHTVTSPDMFRCALAVTRLARVAITRWGNFGARVCGVGVPVVGPGGQGRCRDRTGLPPVR
jgi:hypothetical protein